MRRQSSSRGVTRERSSSISEVGVPFVDGGNGVRKKGFGCTCRACNRMVRISAGRYFNLLFATLRLCRLTRLIISLGRRDILLSPGEIG